MPDIELDLNEVSIPCRKDLDGVVRWTISEKGKVNIRTKTVHGADWDDVLDEQVPDSKNWQVVLSIKILETDA